jgi:hypothetical protein
MLTHLLDLPAGEDEVRTQLMAAFGEAGTVVNVRLPTDRETGELKGIGFIEFDSTDAKVCHISRSGLGMFWFVSLPQGRDMLVVQQLVPCRVPSAHASTLLFVSSICLLSYICIGWCG